MKGLIDVAQLLSSIVVPVRRLTLRSTRPERKDELPPLRAFPLRGDGALSSKTLRQLRTECPSGDFQIAAYQSSSASADFTFEILPWYPDPPLLLERAPGYRLVGLVDLSAGRVIPIVEEDTGASRRPPGAPRSRERGSHDPVAQLLVAAAMLWALGIDFWPFDE